MGTLYVVATPIGNLEDISPRALRILREVALIAAEDTRHSARLLDRFGVTTPTISYHAFNERAREQKLLTALAAGDVALITDAGTPGISDPGQALVAAAAAAGFKVSPVPGPSALTAAVSVSGIVDGPFSVLGFLPREATDRRRLLARAAAARIALVVFEAPERAASTLAELAGVLGDRDAVACRELTKLHEEIRRGTLTTLASWAQEFPPRGELVIVVAAGAGPAADQEEDPKAVVRGMLAAGMKPSEAAREAAALTGRPRSELYALARDAGRNQSPKRQ
jgi:16S rRNA (cytidine1402-2'-O)-methyltransferase